MPNPLLLALVDDGGPPHAKSVAVDAEEGMEGDLRGLGFEAEVDVVGSGVAQALLEPQASVGLKLEKAEEEEEEEERVDWGAGAG